MGADFLFVACPSQFEAGDILTKACTDAKVWGRNLVSIGHFRKGTLISSGMLSAAPALPVRPSVYPTRGVLLGTGTTPFNMFIHEVTRQGGIAIDYPDPDKNASAIKCIHIGSDGIFKIPNVRNINLILDEQAKGIGISGVRVPPSDTICVVSVPTANSSSRIGAGSQKRGWKETRSDLKEKGWRPSSSLPSRVEHYRVILSRKEIRCGEGTL